jgi:E3 ubiquitin-protein ligase ZNF598
LHWVQSRLVHFPRTVDRFYCAENMEDCCAVCAEPVEWVAYGPCGHKETCSKCVVRLRVVLKDKRCVICQAQHDAVIATKFMGSFTVIKPPDYFTKLKVGAFF